MELRKLVNFIHRNVESFKIEDNKHNITKIMNTGKDILDIYDIMIIEYKKFIKNKKALRTK